MQIESISLSEQEKSETNTKEKMNNNSLQLFSMYETSRIKLIGRIDPVSVSLDSIQS